MAPMPWNLPWKRPGRWLALPLAGALFALLPALLLAPACGWREGGRHFARPQDRALVAAVMAGKVDEVRRAAAAGGDVDAVGDYGDTPLDMAMMQRQREAFAALLALGAHAARPSGDRGAPLHRAAMLDDPWYLEQALAAGADPDVLRPGARPVTPLLVAIDAGRPANALALIKGKADVNAAPGPGATSPLFHAVAMGQFEVAVALLEAGADPRRAAVEVRALLADTTQPAQQPPAGSEAWRWRQRLLERLP